eukprot:12722150-Prorocentrum_lima.AAC.1
MTSSLVGSEMCIRDSPPPLHEKRRKNWRKEDTVFISLIGKPTGAQENMITAPASATLLERILDQRGTTHAVTQDVMMGSCIS